MGEPGFRIEGINLSGRSRGFFCSKNWKNPSFAKTTVESGCGQLTTTIRKNTLLASRSARNLTLFLVKKLTGLLLPDGVPTEYWTCIDHTH